MTLRAKTSTYILLIAGLGLAIGLIVHQGIDDVARSVAAVGWGLLAVTFFHLIPLILDTLGWRALFERRERLPFADLLWVRWIGESVNQLLPVAQVGGEIVRSRLLTFRNMPGARAGALVVVDLTVGVFVQALFTLIGLALLFAHYGDDGGIATNAAVGAGLFLFVVGGFYLAQRRGLFRLLARFIEWAAGERAWFDLAGGAARLEQATFALYRRRRAILANGVWQLSGWIVGTGEVWLVLYFMGAPVSLVDALLLESLGQAVRAAGFLVPGALGIQEGGYLLVGAVLGVAPEAALALSLAKRVREILLGLPALLAWQVIEGRRLVRRRD
ncbi:MAG: lysylphosphatidylglycerol synthase domain-containing protein [Alphaproteobacteria bacterium]